MPEGPKVRYLTDLMQNEVSEKMLKPVLVF
jgi:hypothetical protein